MEKVEQSKMDIFYRKKTVVTFFLSVLVVLLHNHSFDGYQYVGTLGNIFKYMGKYLTSGMTGGAIRLFFLISGVLFYRNYTYGKTMNKYQSRFQSLVKPYLLWCTFYTVVFMLAGRTPVRNAIAIDMTFSLKNILRGIFLNKYYQSLWFIFDLIIFTALCPLIYTVLKNKVVGFATLTVLSVLYALGITIPETVMIGGTEYVAFWRADSIIVYMIGAYIGIHYFDWFASKKSKPIAWASLFLFVACCVIRITTNIYDNKTAWLVLVIAYCFSIWNMFDLFDFENYRVREFYSYSFMMFALNFYLGVYVAKVLFVLLPKAQYFCVINLVLTLVLELGFILGCSRFISKKYPKFYSLITGGR